MPPKKTTPMKRIVIIIAALAIMMGASAQRLNNATSKLPTVPSIEQVSDKQQPKQGKPTGKFYTTKDGDRLPVYQGSKGGMYVERVSKRTGKPYRQYLNKRQQAKLK